MSKQTKSWLDADEQIVAEFGRVQLFDIEPSRTPREKKYLDVKAEKLAVTNKRIMLADNAGSAVAEVIRSISHAKNYIAGLRAINEQHKKEFKEISLSKKMLGQRSDEILRVIFYIGVEKERRLIGASNSLKIKVNYFIPKLAELASAASAASTGGFVGFVSKSAAKIAAKGFGSSISYHELKLEFREGKDKERLDEFIAKVSGDEKALEEYSSNEELLVREYMHQ